jgi:thiamine biosynthesis lipoprotein
MRFIVFVLFPLLLLSEEMLTRTQALMGTFAHITLPKNENKQISRSFQQMKEIERSLSSYDPEALVYRLNQTHEVPYDTTLAEAIMASKQYYQHTQGYFDITIGSISKDLYRFGETNSTIPSDEALAKSHLNIEGITIHHTFIKSDQNITIDLGGIGKGYAVDKVVERLRSHNISQGIVALSGDIRCLDQCTFVLQSPFSDQAFASLSAKRAQLSISTSGTYRRYVKDQTHHHLINPKTTAQGKAFVSVSLFTYADNTKIDAYATAISVMTKEEAFSFLSLHEDIGFILVDSSGKIFYGNLAPFLLLQWIAYKEKATMSKSTKKTSKNNTKEINLIHPDITTPTEIRK